MMTHDSPDCETARQIDSTSSNILVLIISTVQTARQPDSETASVELYKYKLAACRQRDSISSKTASIVLYKYTLAACIRLLCTAYRTQGLSPIKVGERGNTARQRQKACLPHSARYLSKQENTHIG